MIVDYGGQYTHLLARRLREIGVFSEIIPYSKLKPNSELDAHVVILSGGSTIPVDIDKQIRESVEATLHSGARAILGIGFGHQLLAFMVGGRIETSCGEYGKILVRFVSRDPLLSGLEAEQPVWMNHVGCVSYLPQGADVLAVSENGYIAAFKAEMSGKLMYGIQFHPEVSHTPRGRMLLENFVKLAGLEMTWQPSLYLEIAESIIRESVREKGIALAAISGGIDSTVSTLLAKKVLGDDLIPVLIDHGLFREGEISEVSSRLEQIGLKPIVIEAQERFLSRLEGVESCEERRIIFSEEYARVLDEVASELGAKYIVQGTIYPDVVESGLGISTKIKTHHNVGGLPDWFRRRYIIIEPLKYFYKDEVRALGTMLGLPEYFLKRHPFPGPGLSVRIIGRFTREKLAIARRASKILEDVLREKGLIERVWQAFATVGDDKWVGVKGDARIHGYIVTLRVVESVDAMSADFAKIPYDVLEEVAKRIYTDIPEVSMVTYAITPKPPSTIEPC